MAEERGERGRLAAVALVSAVGLAYEVALMRIFSIAQWHHFAYMIISIGMLGFGASGMVLALLRERLRGREAVLFPWCVLGVAVAVPVSYALSQWVPFETNELVSQPKQLQYLLALYLVLALPFFLVSACITLGFLLLPAQVGRVYCYNMIGSGLGAGAIVGLMYWLHPATLPPLLALIAACAHACVPRRGRLRQVHRAWPVVLALGIVFFDVLPPIRLSEYKGLSYAQHYPDAEIVAEAHSPLSVVTALESELIRETPGQIGRYPMSDLGRLPAQIGLYFDGGGVSPVHRFDGDFGPFAYLDYVTSAVAYRLVEEPRVLVLGAGGGTDVLQALSHGAEHVTAVEVDPRVVGLMTGPLAGFSGGLYERADVTTVVAEGRRFLEAGRERYDLIQISQLEAFNAAAAGVHALSESYLYTEEAMLLYLDRLTPEGVLVITRWLKTPARDVPKMFATVVRALERRSVFDPGPHLVMLRSWNNATIVASASPLTAAQVEAVRTFAEARGFDLCYYPGITRDEVNRYTILQRPVYYEAAMAILSEDREAFYESALFELRPATDNRPYFSRFFRWGSLPRLLEGMGTEWVPFVEWGYVTLVATLAQGILVSVLLILLPLIVFARTGAARHAKRWVFLCLSALGAAYMFMEIAFIQRLMLFLAYPIYAVAVVLSGFLVFSGLGSLFAHRCAKPRRAAARAVAALAVLAIIYFVSLPSVFRAGAGLNDPARIVISLALLAPLAFCMGIPFPLALQAVSTRYELLLPWAWGLNGCASVVGATLATLIAVHFGFSVLVGAAIVAYAVALTAYLRLSR